MDYVENLDLVQIMCFKPEILGMQNCHTFPPLLYCAKLQLPDVWRPLYDNDLVLRCPACTLQYGVSHPFLIHIKTSRGICIRMRQGICGQI